MKAATPRNKRARLSETESFTPERRVLDLSMSLKVTYLQDLRYRLPFHEVWLEYFPKDPPARIAIQVADANAQPGGNAHFALDVIALDPNA
jgi:hypothetical protein